MVKKKGYKKERGWKKHPDLYDNLEEFSRLGFTKEDLGLLYINFLLEKRPGKKINNLNLEGKSKEEIEKITRPLKKAFQKETRYFFSEVKNQVKHTHAPKEQILPNLEISSIIEKVDYEKSGVPTIETTIRELLVLNKEKAFQKIGNALLKGTRFYRKKRRNVDSPYLFKLFLEYNGILNALKSEKESYQNK